MANTARRRRTDYRISQRTTRVYEDGNAVRKLQERPTVRPVRPEEESRPATVSRVAVHNRARATGTSMAFVCYLAVVCAVILFACVNYLQMKSQLTEKAETLESLETAYNDLKTDNDSYYSEVLASADLESIKAIAIKRLGMQYPTSDQILTYSIDHSSSVTQYQDVPEADE